MSQMRTIVPSSLSYKNTLPASFLKILKLCLFMKILEFDLSLMLLSIAGIEYDVGETD